MEEKKTGKKRKKKSEAAYDTYLMNVSNGLNPPSEKKKRKKKPADDSAYEEFLQEIDEFIDTLPEKKKKPAKASGEPAPKKKKTAKKPMESSEEAVSKKKKPAVKKPAAVSKQSDNESLLDLASESAARPARRKHRAEASQYDRYISELEGTEPTRERRSESLRLKSARQKRRAGVRAGDILYIAAMLVILAGFALFAYRTNEGYRHFTTMRSSVDAQSFYPGTTVDGYDFSGMTYEEAETLFTQSVEPMYRNRSVSISTGEQYLAEQLGYSSNYTQVLRTAWSQGRGGSLRERYESMQSGEMTAQHYVVSRSFYTDQAIRDIASVIAARVYTEPQDPYLSGFDVETKEFVFTEGETGTKLNEDQFVADIKAKLDAGGGAVDLVLMRTQSDADVDAMKAQYGRISYLTTDASTSKSNRITNLKVACAAINGLKLDPGKEFSYNGTLGQRTAEKGYKEAGVYAGGTTATGIGGGICQVASTLFDVAVMADMEITQRQPHSLPVHYLEKGTDCAINWPNQDLKFINTSDEPVYIVAYVTDKKQVVCAIYGKLLPDGESIEIEAHTTERLSYTTVYKVDTSLATGAQRVEEGHKGYKAVAYKIRKDANGKQISKEVLCYSTYYPADTVVYYGP